MRLSLLPFLLFPFLSLNSENLIQESFVETKGAQIFCKTIGDGNPMVVLHGGPGLVHNYLFPSLSKLAPNNFVLFFDQRANGFSTGEISHEMINLDAFIEDIETLRKSYGLSKINLLGHCWGGLLAIKYAITYPEFVNKLILVDSVPPSSDDSFTVLRKFMQATAPYQKEIKEIEQSVAFSEEDPATLKRYIQLREKASFYNPEKIDMDHFNFPITKKSIENGLKISEIFMEDMLSNPFNWYAEMKTFSFQTLIVHGIYDFIPLSIPKKLHKNIPHSKLLFIENCGHCPFIEKTEELLSHLADFLEEK